MSAWLTSTIVVDLSHRREFTPPSRAVMHYVYMLKNKDTGKLYIGYSNNLKSIEGGVQFDPS